MARGKGKKAKDNAPPKNSSTTSKEIKTKFGKKMKKSVKMNVAPSSSSGLPTSSIPNPHTSLLGASSSAFASTSTIKQIDVQKKDKDKGSMMCMSGFIFMCNRTTKPDCYKFRVFGLPRGQLELVKKVKQGAKLFLFDTDLKLLYGIYKATTTGELNLEALAFNGKYPAQVGFSIVKDCLPLPESSFKHAIKDNYQGRRFKQELTGKQVNDLVSLFRPLPAASIASAGFSLTDGAMPHAFSPVLDEKLLPPRQPPPEDFYPSEVHHSCSSSVLDPQAFELAPRHLYMLHETEACEARTKTTIGPRYVVQQPAFHHQSGSYYADVQQPASRHQSGSYYADVQQPASRHQSGSYYFDVHQPASRYQSGSFSADVHSPYLPDKPFSTSEDTYRRYDVLPQMVPIDRPVSQRRGTSLLPREREIHVQPDDLSEYNGRQLPLIASAHVPLQAKSLDPSYAVLHLGDTGVGLSSSYESYCAPPINNYARKSYPDPGRGLAPRGINLTETDLEVSSYYPARAAMTYR